MAEPADRIRALVTEAKNLMGRAMNNIDVLADIAERLGGTGPNPPERPAWYDDPATQDQIDAIRRWGLEPKAGMKKGEASKILGKLAGKG